MEFVLTGKNYQLDNLKLIITENKVNKNGVNTTISLKYFHY